MVDFKEKVKAFQVTNKVYSLVKKFNKEFLSLVSDYDVEQKLSMYALCIKYMKETLDKRFK